MTYRNRTKKTRSRKLDSWSQRSIGWLTEQGRLHQAPYLTDHYREICDPHTGKYIGWAESPFKAKQLKKAMRRGDKAIIAQGLLDIMEDEEDELRDLISIWEQDYMDEYDEILRREAEQMELDSMLYDDYDPDYGYELYYFEIGEDDYA